MGALLLALLYLATAAALAVAPPAVGRRRAAPWVAAALGLIPLAFTASGFLPGRALTPTPLLAGVPPWADPAQVAAIDAGSSGANPLLLDPVSQMIPWRRAARDGLLFDPGQGGGAALLGNGQSAALYPTELAARALSPFRAVTYSQAARLLVAVWGMFWLARALALAELPALLAAAAFAGSGFLQLWRLHPHSLAAATVPWIALAALVAVRRPGPGAAVALAVAGAVGLAAGHPETLLHGVLFALLLAVPVAMCCPPEIRSHSRAARSTSASLRSLRHTQRHASVARLAAAAQQRPRCVTVFLVGGTKAGRLRPRGRRRPRGGLGRGAATGAVAAALAFLLAAPLLLPLVANLRASAEWAGREDRRRQTEVPLGAAVERLAPAAAQLALGDPRRNTWEGPENLAELGGGALGAAALVAAGLVFAGGTGPRARRRRRLALLLAAVGVVGLLVGAHFPVLSKPFGWLPVLRDSLLKRLALWWVLAGSLLAGLGAEAAGLGGRLRWRTSGLDAGTGGPRRERETVSGSGEKGGAKVGPAGAIERAAREPGAMADAEDSGLGGMKAGRALSPLSATAGVEIGSLGGGTGGTAAGSAVGRVAPPVPTARVILISAGVVALAVALAAAVAPAPERQRILRLEGGALVAASLGLLLSSSAGRRRAGGSGIPPGASHPMDGQAPPTARSSSRHLSRGAAPGGGAGLRRGSERAQEPIQPPLPEPREAKRGGAPPHRIDQSDGVPSEPGPSSGERPRPRHGIALPAARPPSRFQASADDRTDPRLRPRRAWRSRLALPTAAALLLAAILVPRAALFARWVPLADAASFYPETLATRYVTGRLAADPAAGWRVAGMDAALAPHSAVFFGFEEARAYDPLTFAPYHAFLAAAGEVPRTGWVRLLDPALPALDLLGVRFVFDHPSMTARPGVEVAYLGHDAIVYENPGALPRLFVPRRLAVEPATGRAVAAARAIDDFAALAVVDRLPSGIGEGRRGEAAPAGPVANGAARVEALRVGRGRIDAVVTALRPAVVASGQPAIPGWRLALDGAPAPEALLRTDGAFLGAAVPAGRHRLSFVYRPPGWRAGLALAALGLALAAGLLVRARHIGHHRRAPRTGPPSISAP